MLHGWPRQDHYGRCIYPGTLVDAHKSSLGEPGCGRKTKDERGRNWVHQSSVSRCSDLVSLGRPDYRTPYSRLPVVILLLATMIAMEDVRQKHQRDQQLSRSSVVKPPIKRRCAAPGKDEHTLCVLHALISRNKADISVGDVISCLQVHGKAAYAVDQCRRTPVLLAVQQGCSDQVIRTLFNANPNAVVQVDCMGQTALGLLYHASKPTSLLQYVLVKKPSLALWESTSFSRRKIVDCITQSWSKASVSQAKNDHTGWIKLILTVRAAYQATFDPRSIGQDDELHLALEMGLPANVLRLFVELYPHQVSRPMARHGGILPLHYVLLAKMFNAGKPPYDGSIVLKLLDAFPGAAAASFRGQLPLHMALTQGRQWTDGLHELVLAYPPAIHAVDPTLRLYPVMIAASCGKCSLDTVFSLLQECPCL